MELVLENERQIILDWKQGNKKAYEKLVKHYMSDAFLVALGYVGDPDDARDLSQDAFVKAYQARERFDADRPFYPWLYRIIKNHCLNFIRRGRHMQPLYYDDNPDRERFPANVPSPLETLERDERHRILRAAIMELSIDHREIITLKNFKGHSYQEISEILDVPIGTVMSRLYYARKALKVIIERIEANGVPQSEGITAGAQPATGEA